MQNNTNITIPKALLRYEKSHMAKTSQVPDYQIFISWNVFGVKEFTWRRVFAQFVLTHWAAVHERLSNYWQTRINNVWLVNIKYEVWILDHVHPESKR